ncbi:uncharacterized protein LOC132062217 [Lycium ferocissimum]|uniref:uncharacterized protein LOC132062217 n=1 Tax=Lycium ferocissimum TaxID=112874 RepID=UPI0028154831|nr:uncharacterized protein LOC132062217 [Lycium ferocissimum]
MIVKLEEDELKKEELKSRNALIVHVLGDLPGYNYMKRYINHMWYIATTIPDIYYHEEGYYIVKLQSEEDMHEVLFSGPYSINNRPVILKQWSPEFDFSTEFLFVVPLWVKFPDLPISCWSCNSLSRIASAIGIPLFVDECTTKQTRISYARMLIKINVTKPLLSEIEVLGTYGEIFQQAVVYDWKPDFCATCLSVGHDCAKVQANRQPLARVPIQQPQGHAKQHKVQNKRKHKRVVQRWQARGGNDNATTLANVNAQGVLPPELREVEDQAVGIQEISTNEHLVDIRNNLAGKGNDKQSVNNASSRESNGVNAKDKSTIPAQQPVENCDENIQDNPPLDKEGFRPLRMSKAVMANLLLSEQGGGFSIHT